MMDCEQEIEIDCAVCLQRCHHPTKLPCSHVFCFLCVKGIAIQTKKCAMCRAAIPTDYFKNPVLLAHEANTSAITSDQQDGTVFQWYYEGRNGWWKYDERSNEELEESYNAGESQCSLLLAGNIYDIDFTSMLQVQHNNRTRRRRVRRDTPLWPSKGVAGIKMLDSGVEPPKNDGGQNPDVAENEPQSEPTDDNLTSMVERLSVINLDPERNVSESENT